jgi:hypothetical protein
MYREKVQAALVLQSAWRGLLARAEFAAIKGATITIQRCYRAYRTRLQRLEARTEKIAERYFKEAYKEHILFEKVFAVDQQLQDSEQRSADALNTTIDKRSATAMLNTLVPTSSTLLPPSLNLSRAELERMKPASQLSFAAKTEKRAAKRAVRKLAAISRRCVSVGVKVVKKLNPLPKRKPKTNKDGTPLRPKSKSFIISRFSGMLSRKKRLPMQGGVGLLVGADTEEELLSDEEVAAVAAAWQALDNSFSSCTDEDRLDSSFSSCEGDKGPIDLDVSNNSTESNDGDPYSRRSLQHEVKVMSPIAHAKSSNGLGGDGGGGESCSRLISTVLVNNDPRLHQSQRIGFAPTMLNEASCVEDERRAAAAVVVATSPAAAATAALLDTSNSNAFVGLVPTMFDAEPQLCSTPERPPLQLKEASPCGPECTNPILCNASLNPSTSVDDPPSSPQSWFAATHSARELSSYGPTSFGMPFSDSLVNPLHNPSPPRAGAKNTAGSPIQDFSGCSLPKSFRHYNAWDALDKSFDAANTKKDPPAVSCEEMLSEMTELSQHTILINTLKRIAENARGSVPVPPSFEAAVEAKPPKPPSMIAMVYAAAQKQLFASDV